MKKKQNKKEPNFPKLERELTFQEKTTLEGLFIAGRYPKYIATFMGFTLDQVKMLKERWERTGTVY